MLCVLLSPQSPISFFDAVRLGLRRVFNYKGRSSVAEYWWLWLAQLLSIVGLTVAAGLVESAYEEGAITKGALDSLIGGIGLLLLLVVVVGTLMTIAAGVRRLHDTGKSGAFLLLGLVPFVGGIILLVLLLAKGEAGLNQYGPGYSNPHEGFTSSAAYTQAAYPPPPPLSPVPTTAPPTPAPMMPQDTGRNFCANCGSALHGSRFCTSCGIRA
jgi:uncharacterized membrane protein YhaH (DUF805 family)